VTGSIDGLILQSCSYRKRRSLERYVLCCTSLVLPGIVVLLTLAFLSKLLWPPLIYSLWMAPPWILGVCVFLLFKKEKWAIPQWRADALADLKSNSKGVFMASHETNAADWSAQDFSSVNLDVKIPWVCLIKWLALAAAIVIVLLLPDLRRTSGIIKPQLAPFERMENMVALLQENDLAEEELLEEAKEALKELKEETNKSLDPADWQAMDSIKNDLMRQALESYQDLNQKINEFSQLKDMLTPSESLEETMDRLKEMNESELGKLVSGFSKEELKEFLEKCQGKAAEMTEEQLALLKELSNRLTLTPEQLKTLQEALKDLKFSKNAQLELCNLTQKELDELIKRLKNGELKFTDEDVEKLKALLLAGASACKEDMKACALAGLLPGRGGVNEGPGHAPLLGKGQTDKEFGGFKEETFSGNLADPEVPLGFSYVPPDPEGSDIGALDSKGAPQQFKGNEGRITWHSRLLPRHNDVMKKYFQEEKKK